MLLLCTTIEGYCDPHHSTGFWGQSLGITCKEQLYGAHLAHRGGNSQLPVSILMLLTLALKVMSQEYTAAVLHAHCMQALYCLQASEPRSLYQRPECKGKAQRVRTHFILHYIFQNTKKKWKLPFLSYHLPQERVRLEQISILKQLLLLIGISTYGNEMELNLLN